MIGIFALITLVKLSISFVAVSDGKMLWADDAKFIIVINPFCLVNIFVRFLFALFEMKPTFTYYLHPRLELNRPFVKLRFLKSRL